jgi:RNA polymerase sigma-70 factor (ECF subfamily)
MEPDAKGDGDCLSTADIERLYRGHGHLVLRRARTILGNDADAQEALQEVFAALLRAPGELRAARSVVGWLYGATTHHCLNVLRNRRTGARLVELHVVPMVVTAAHARADVLAEARDVLARLPDEVGAAAVYHHVDGMTYDEIAEQLGCSRRKVGYLLERAQGVADPARKERTS